MTKDNELKRITGSRNFNDQTPQLPVHVPNPPAHLTARELVIWNRTCESLVKLNHCTEADYDLVYDYVTLRARKDELDEQVKEQGLMVEMVSGRGKIIKRVNPMHTESIRIVPLLDKMRKELGFSPEARQKIRSVESALPHDEDEEFLSNL